MRDNRMLMLCMCTCVLFCLASYVQCKDGYCANGCRRLRRVLITDCPHSEQALTTISKYLERFEGAFATAHQSVRLLTSDNEWLLDEETTARLTSHCNGTNSIDDTVLATLNVIKDVVSATGSSNDRGHLEITVLLAGDDRVNSDYNDVLPIISDIVQASDLDHHAFHFFIRPANKGAQLLGSTVYSVTYKDSTHLNIALTLAQLIKHDLTQTLQAHLLSNGVLATVNDFKDLLIFPFPSFEEMFGYLYIDMCASVTCPEGSYCSPLHGCTRLSDSRPATTSDSRNNVSLNQEYISLGHSVNPTTSAPPTSSSTDTLSIMQDSAKGIPLSDVISNRLEAVNWKVDKPFVKKLIKKGEPMLLRNTVVSLWRAMNKSWGIDHVCDVIDGDILQNVKCSNSFLTFDPDVKAPLKLNLTIPYVVKNISKLSFCSCIQEKKRCEFNGYYYFGKVPDALKDDFKPNDLLFNTEQDLKSEKQFIWISSKGMITHGHFDQDFNVFVQLIGEKRFTLWSPWQHELMYMYPRVHPLWHKSRINFNDPDISKYPDFSHSKATVVTVGPGDVLFIPPYTWHYVETLTQSISLSTWSHDYHMYSHMNAIYGHDHKFDLLQNSTGQMFALRMYLDLLIQDIYGYRYTSKYFRRVLSTRFRGLEHHFPPRPEDPGICDPLSVPTCQHVYGYAKLDVAIVGGHFKELSPEVMDILLMDYIEEISTQVVGINQLLAFFRYCFQGQDYHMTEINQPEHSLWD